MIRFAFKQGVIPRAGSARVLQTRFLGSSYRLYQDFKPKKSSKKSESTSKNETKKEPAKRIKKTNDIPTSPTSISESIQEQAKLLEQKQQDSADKSLIPPEQHQQPEQAEELEEPEDEYLTTIFENVDPYMDTYDVFKRLQEAGFTSEQASEIINLLIVQLNTKLTKLTTKYSHLYELENEQYLFESAQQELRVDITRSREAHINELINLINILERDFNIISDELNNDFLQLKNNNEVTINDQKQENTLLLKKIMLTIQETNHKISTELNSALRSEIESLRWHLSRWGLIAILICVFSGCASFYIYKVKNSRLSKTREEFIPLVIYEPSEYDEDDYHTDLDKSIVDS